MDSPPLPSPAAKSQSSPGVLDDRRLIIFLHGVGANCEMWRPQLDTFADTLRMVAPDLPGHGEHAGQPFTVETALRLIDNLAEGEAQPVLLAGLSLGGFIAMEYAANYPERVAGMVLSSCGENTTSRLLRFATRINHHVLRLIGTRHLERLEEKVIRRAFPAEIAEPLISRGISYKMLGQVYEAIIGTDYREKLARFPGPVLILNGEGDRFTRLGEGSLLAAAPNARLQIIPEAAHLCNLEQPELYNQAFSRFSSAIDE